MKANNLLKHFNVSWLCRIDGSTWNLGGDLLETTFQSYIVSFFALMVRPDNS